MNSNEQKNKIKRERKTEKEKKNKMNESVTYIVEHLFYIGSKIYLPYLYFLYLQLFIL